MGSCRTHGARAQPLPPVLVQQHRERPAATITPVLRGKRPAQKHPAPRVDVPCVSVAGSHHSWGSLCFWEVVTCTSNCNQTGSPFRKPEPNSQLPFLEFCSSGVTLSPKAWLGQGSQRNRTHRLHVHIHADVFREDWLLRVWRLTVCVGRPQEAGRAVPGPQSTGGARRAPQPPL